MRHRQRLLLLMLTTTLVSLMVAGIALWILYRTTFRQTQARLRELVLNQANLIEALSCGNCLAPSDLSAAEKAILQTLENAYQPLEGFNQSTELIIAKYENQHINCLLHHQAGRLTHPQLISWQHRGSEPIRRALMGQSGVMVGLDSQNRRMLAAYEPITSLQWGLVSKIPLSEVQAPFIKAGILTILAGLGSNSLGVILIYRLSSTLAHDLEGVENALLQEHQLITLFLDTVGSLIIVLNPAGKIVRFNKTCEKVTDYQEQEVLGQFFWDIFLIPEEREGVKTVFQLLTTQGYSLCHENYWLTKTGKKRYILWTNAILRHSNGQIAYVIGTGMDITEEREIRQELQQLNENLEKQVQRRTRTLKRELLLSAKIMETSPVGILLLNPDGKIMIANERSQSILGIHSTQSSNSFIFALPDAQWTYFQGNPIPDEDLPYQKVMRTHHPLYQCHCSLRWTEDIQSFLSLNAAPLLDENRQLQGIILTLEDITERMREQKEKLSQEAQFRAIFDNAVLGIALVNQEQTIMQSNYALTSILGYSTAELAHKHLSDFLCPNSDDYALIYSPCLQQAEASATPLEQCLICKNGVKIWVHIFASVILQEDSLIPLELVMIEDVTLKKQAQDIQNQLIRRNESFIQALGEIVYEHDVVEDIIEWRGRYTELLGYNSEEIGNSSHAWLSRVYPDDLSKMLAEFDRAFLENKLYDLEYRFRHQQGHYLWVHDRGVMLGEKAGKPEQVIGIMLDITKRKERETELQATKDQLNTILSNISDGISVFDPDHRLIYVNTVLAHSMGYDSPEAMLKEWNEQTLSDKFELFDENGDGFPLEQLPSRLALKGQIVQPTIMRFHLKKAKQPQWSIVQSSPVFDEQGKVKLAVTITHNITQLKQTEISLRESEDRYRTIIETVNEGILMLDENGEIIFANEILAQMLGYPLREILGMSIFIFMDDRNRQLLKYHLAALRQGKAHHYDLELITNQGYAIWTTISSNPLLNEAGNYSGSLSLVTDISQRKQIEEALRESEEKLRAILNAIQDALLLIEPQGNILIANQTVAQRLGTSLDQLLSSNLFDYLAPELRSNYWAKIIEAIYTRKLIQFEDRQFDKERQEERDINHCIYPIKDHSDHITRIAILSQDITEKKQAEIALQESEERFRLLVENIEEVLWINPADPRQVIYISPAYEKIWGRSSHSLYEEGTSWLDTVYPDDRKKQETALEKMAQSGVYEEEYRIVRPAGKSNGVILSQFR